MACFAIVGLILSLLMSLFVDDNVLPTRASDIFILLLGGMLGLLGQFFTTMSLKLEYAGKVALTVKSTQILFSFIFQTILFDVSQLDILAMTSSSIQMHPLKPVFLYTIFRPNHQLIVLLEQQSS